MFDIDKKDFGYFIAELRKEKGLTQKELAEKLFVSDKAVSKWECGLSMPDITLLVPISKILDVTVTELLECKRLENIDNMQMEKVDEIVNKAISSSSEENQAEVLEKMQTAFLVCVLLCCLEVLLSLATGMTIGQFAGQNILLFVILGLVFGVWFCFFVKDKLPVYYDEEKISFYCDGFFRMQLTGVHLNNSNWRYIVLVGRIGLIFGLGGLFIPMYVVAKMYE